MATAVQDFTGNPTEKATYELGVLAGVEYSKEPNASLTEDEKAAIKTLCADAARRDYPARLLEVIQAWEAALFFRGFQFLLPQKGGGWKIPGESTGYGPSMQMDLSLLPTNIYSANAQIIISTLTRAVPNVRFGPQEASNAAQITAAESAYKFIKVIERNNDLMMTQTDASRYLWTDGRFCYYTRFMKDGPRFGWEEDDQPDDIIPENEPPEGGEAPAPVSASPENPPEVNPEAAAEVPMEAEEQAEAQPVAKKRTPRGQEVRTAHGKLEIKLVPMMANTLDECDVLQFEIEVDESRAKGMFPEVADEIKAGQTGLTEGQIARLARLNVKLGMQSTYITSDSVAKDVTLQRSWFKRSALMGVKDDTVRDSLIEKFPDGMVCCYAGETFCYARNEGMDDCWALGNAFSGDGQNRNALGTSLLPIQKRINNWLDLMNDYFIRTVPKKWLDSKAFAVDAIKAQTNVPGDIGSFKRQPGVPFNELMGVEPSPTHNPSLPDFVKEYIGPISQLIGGAYPALSGGDTGSNDLMDVDELIPTPTGFVRNGDLRDGNVVFGQDGRCHKVLKAHPEKTKQAFKVSFDDGTNAIVHDGHLWTTFTRGERLSLKRHTEEWRAERRAARKSRATGGRGLKVTAMLMERNRLMKPPTSPPSEGTVRRTDEILATLKTPQGANNHSIRLSMPLHLPEKHLLIDPYCLGAWLGDGSADGGIFTGAEDDVLSILFHFSEAGFPFKRCKDEYLWSISKLVPKLRTIGVLGNKHIPHDYLWASEAQRLALLQGLMDTDGCATTGGTAVFVNTNQILADGVYHLAASLGLKPTKNMQMSVPIYNKKYDKWYGGDVPTYRISWTSSMPVFRMERKLKRLNKKTRKTQDWRYITNIELVGERRMRCLTTSNPTGLYLFGKNFNVTHNTKGGIITQRNQALGRLGQTWHSIQNAEATAMRQAVRWGAKCRDKSINERIPGGEAIQLEINNLKANILCYPEADDSFPESHIDKQNRLTQFIQESAKNPMMQEVFFNAANLEFLQSVLALTDLQIPQVISRNKQLAEIEILLKGAPVPNPMIEQAKEKAAQLMGMGVDAAHFDQAQVEAEQMPQEVSSVPIDPDNDDNETEAATCWLWINLPEGRKAKRTHPDGFKNVSLHRQEHLANQAKKAGVGQPKKPPSVSINYKDVADPAAQAQILAEAAIKSSPQAQPAALPKLVKPAPENTPENHPANAPKLLRNKPEAGSQIQ